MELKIVRQANHYLYQSSKLKWELIMKKQDRLILFYGLAGIGLAILSILNRSGIWNFYTSAAAVFIILLVRLFYHSTIAKNKFLAVVKKAMLSDDGDATLIVKEEMICYRDNKSYCELNWPYFSSYKLCEGFLFLVTGENLMTSMSINKEEMTTSEFLDLIQFIESKLPEWK